MSKNESIQEESNLEKGLTAKQAAAIAAIMEEPSMEKAAKKAGIGRATLYRWMEIPAFRTALEKGQRTVFSSALARLQGASRLAVEKLIEALEGKSPTEKRLAASQILDLCFKAQEMGEFSERLFELEEKLLFNRRVS